MLPILDVRIFGDPILRQEAREVTVFDEQLQSLADNMLETMRAAPGVGLAAPQVGILSRLFTWEVQVVGEDEEDTTTEGGAVVNPVLKDSDDAQLLEDEGCLSFPGLFYPVERPVRVEVSHADTHGDEHVVQLERFLARVWLHEMDHLNGVLFIDHLEKHDRKEAMRLMREYREEHGIDPAPKLGNLLFQRDR